MFRALTCPSSGGKNVEDNSVTNILLINKENSALKLVDEIIQLYMFETQFSRNCSVVQIQDKLVH